MLSLKKNKHNLCFAVSCHQWLLWQHLPCYFMKPMYLSHICLSTNSDSHPHFLPLLPSCEVHCCDLDYEQVNCFCSWICLAWILPRHLCSSCSSSQYPFTMGLIWSRADCYTTSRCAKVPEWHHVTQNLLLRPHCFPDRWERCFFPLLSCIVLSIPCPALSQVS